MVQIYASKGFGGFVFSFPCFLSTDSQALVATLRLFRLQFIAETS